MLVEYRGLIELNFTTLCAMDPHKVMNQLVRMRAMKVEDRERMESKKTTKEKNLYILDVLLESPFIALSKFLRVLNSIDHTHLELAELIQPVGYRIVWFTPDPAHAAAVVYALEKYDNAIFSKMQRIGSSESLVARRARVFVKEYSKEKLKELSEKLVNVQDVVKRSHEVEVCLLFPVSLEVSDISSALEACFEEDVSSDADLVIMSGTLSKEGGRSLDERRAMVIAPEAAYDEEIESVTSVRALPTELKTLETSLLQTLKGSPTWSQKELTSSGPLVEFACLGPQTAAKSSRELPVLDCAEDALDKTYNIISDPLASHFYSLCQDKRPGKSSLVCKGVLSSKEEAGDLSQSQVKTDSTVAVFSSCILMEICKHYYKTHCVSMETP